MTKRRTFRHEDDAARQVASLLPWFGSHVELRGIWVTVGHDGDALRWEQLYGPLPLQPAAYAVEAEILV